MAVLLSIYQCRSLDAPFDNIVGQSGICSAADTSHQRIGAMRNLFLLLEGHWADDYKAVRRYC